MGRSVNRSTALPGWGQRTSSQAILFCLPVPSTRRGSCEDRKLPPPTFILLLFKSPAWYVMRAPIASGFDFLPTRRTPSQWFLPTLLFRRRTGAPSLTEISTSTAPSLLKSPIAIPRAENDFAKAGPLCALMFLNPVPVFWNSRSGSLYLTPL